MAIVTYRPTWPKGPSWWKNNKEFSKTNLENDKLLVLLFNEISLQPEVSSSPEELAKRGFTTKCATQSTHGKDNFLTQQDLCPKKFTRQKELYVLQEYLKINNKT